VFQIKLIIAENIGAYNVCQKTTFLIRPPS